MVVAKSQFLRFILVGGLNTLFGYAVFASFLAIGAHYALAALFSTFLGALFNFKTYGRLVFKNSENRLIFRFFGVYLTTYVLGVVLIGVLKTYHLSSYAAGAVLALPMALVSFQLNRRLVFSRMTNPKVDPRKHEPVDSPQRRPA